MSDTSKQCTITNNSGRDIVITMALAANETANNGSVISPEGTLEVLQTSDGSTLIKSGSSGTITLDHSYKPGGDESGYVKDYDLVAGDSNWAYPLANLSVSQQDGNGSDGFAPQTIASGSATALTQAAAFYQTITVYPDTQLAKDYNAAIAASKAAADGGGSADAIAAPLDAFFKSTTDYQEVTLAGLAAIHNYYTHFPAVWARYKDTASFYLYGSDDTTSTFEGVLTLQKTGPLDVTKLAGGYTCSFAPAKTPSDTGSTEVDSSKAVALTYTDGLFVSDPGADNPAIALQGTFLLKSVLTNNPADNNILTVLSGNVNGRVCVGFDAPQAARPAEVTAAALSSSSAEDFWNSLIHPESKEQIIITVLVFGGAALLLGATAGIIYKIVKMVRGGKASKWNEEQQTQIDRWNEKVQRLAGPNAKVDPVNIDNLDQYGAILRNEIRAANLRQGFEYQQECLEQFMELSEMLNSDVMRNLQNSLDRTERAIENLANARPDGLDPVLKTELKTFGEVQVKIQRVQSSIYRNLSKEAQQQLDDNISAADKIYDSSEAAMENDEKEAIERDPKAEGKVLPEEV